MMARGFRHALDVTPDDADVEASVDALYVGTTGNVVVRPAGQASTVTFTDVPAGTIIPIAVTEVINTGTTADNIIGMR